MGRVYRHKDGGRYVSVTTPLPFDPKCDQQTLDRAIDRGNAVDLAVEYHSQGVLDESTLDPTTVPYLEGWKAFLAETGFETMAVKVRVKSDRHKYAGEIDVVGRLPRTPKQMGPRAYVSIVDVKSGDPPVPCTWPLQLSAYLEAYNEEVKPIVGEKHFKKASKRFVVQLMKTGRYRIHEYNEVGDFRDYLAFLRVYRWNERNGQG